MSEAVAMTAESIQPFVNQSEGLFQLDLYLKGVKCGHCVHKITKEIELDSSLNRFQFESGGKRLSLWVDDKRNFAPLISRITSLGFIAIPLSMSNEDAARKQEFKSSLKKLAVAAVCAGNIMLFSTAVYLGADAEFIHFFHKLSLFLVLPVIFYSASSIWYGFFQSIKNLKFNLDFPIGLALLTGLALSFYSFFASLESIYFDSIAVVVFLILTSRFVLNRYVDAIYINNLVQYVPGVYQVRKLIGNESTVVSLQGIKPGDHVLVQKGEVVPVDGLLQGEDAVLDCSVLTGESRPVILKSGEKIFAGSKLCLGEAVVVVDKVSEETRVGQYIKEAQKSQDKEQEESFYWVGRFTVFVVLASALTFAVVWNLIGFTEAYQRAFAIILVACPCAISFGIPLIRSFSGRLAISNGIVLKQPRILRKLQNIDHIFLDKTGTLTNTHVDVSEEDFRNLDPIDQQKLLSLELSMDHPISKGFMKFRDPSQPPYEVKGFTYTPGKGIKGEIQGELWQVYSASNQSSEKRIDIFKNGEKLTQIRLHSSLKSNLKLFFDQLVKRTPKVSLLSGDEPSQVESIRSWLPEKFQGNFVSNAKPEDKVKWVKAEEGARLMVGDGLNDITAMQEADVSVCMPGALEDNISVADVTLIKSELETLLKLFQLSDKTMATERKLLFFTFSYNVFCVLAASLGYITPVAAAILMPISSLTVLSLVTLSLRRL